MTVSAFTLAFARTAADSDLHRQSQYDHHRCILESQRLFASRSSAAIRLNSATASPDGSNCHRTATASRACAVRPPSPARRFCGRAGVARLPRAGRPRRQHPLDRDRRSGGDRTQRRRRRAADLLQPRLFRRSRPKASNARKHRRRFRFPLTNLPRSTTMTAAVSVGSRDV